ncbi:DUF3182 family protein [Pseudomonas syringae]|nr:DUF3182 family protein [Pseudomonas syringae]MBD8573745.1 DUF3182 family protein [Pseudomonas syringae]MBD8792594.1 DUF3182 family protein [Pseudomonas syringae]MBD8802996.1 DUF3182 family protein [Pseudomonas syringae]MBD8813674.1 DUF3182 family protein [Pseudomonas syringae]
MRGSGTGHGHTEVVLLPTEKTLGLHEIVVHQALARQLAQLLGAEFTGTFEATRHQDRRLYFVPSDTLVDPQRARHLHIRSAEDLFGGVVSEPFMATKAISHALLAQAQARPAGWSEAFHAQAGDAVLAGFSAFSAADAHLAGQQLLAKGPVRIKPVRATAGRGQVVARTADELAAALAEQDFAEVARWGLVIEQDLHEVITYSVGQVSVAGHVASYHGTQGLTRDNQGATVYGGSCLWIVRGGFQELLDQSLPAPVRRAVQQAIAYDQAARACLPGFMASRRNYDIAQGVNARGQRCSGVLEQSWRIGGASAAEIHALLALAADPALSRLCVSTHEVYGRDAPLPAHAHVLYEGDDPQLGFLRKYIQVQPYDCKQ